MSAEAPRPRRSPCCGGSWRARARLRCDGFGVPLALGATLALGGSFGLGGCGGPVEADEPARVEESREPSARRVQAEGVTLQVGGDAPLTASAERVSLDEEGPILAEGVSAEADDGVPMHISAARTEWDLRGGVATFSQDVVATRGVFRLACDTLEVRHGPDGRMQSAEARGAVVVTRPPYTARSQRASLDLRSGRLVLLGEPRVDDGKNELTGARVELFLDEERMVCDACALRIPDPTRPLPKAP